MRVVFMSETREVWGAEVSMLTLAEALVARSIDVAVVCPEGELAEQARAIGLQVYVAAVPTTAGGVVAGRALWSTYVSNLREGDRLVLFAYVLVAWAPVFRPVLRRRGVRVALDLHDQLGTTKSYWSVKAASRAVDSIIACSAFTARQLRNHRSVHSLHRPVTAHGEPRTASRRTDRAASRHAFGAAASEPPASTSAAPTPEASESVVSGQVDSVDGQPQFRVGIVGRISPEKRHELLIGAVNRMGPNVHMVVRGSVFGPAADYGNQILSDGARLLGSRFVVEGRVPAEVALDNLDALVVANPAEPMGRTVLEAQLAGVVAVVPDTGGSSELVEDGVTGVKYRADDSVDLARALARIIEDPDLARRIVEAAPASVLGPDQYASRYLAYLG